MKINLRVRPFPLAGVVDVLEYCPFTCTDSNVLLMLFSGRRLPCNSDILIRYPTTDGLLGDRHRSTVFRHSNFQVFWPLTRTRFLLQGCVLWKAMVRGKAHPQHWLLDKFISAAPHRY